ncbi:MAG: hypothetical protein GY710_08680 [Desulfobacteraceae bacterium]|nr:hypothetical protein [Desulfobacteraceae bacterium]
MTHTVHDPCPVRFETKVQKAVRSLAQKQGLTIENTKHSQEKTFCCGEGGSVGCVNQELAKTWVKKRKSESENKKILTYCAGCVNFLSQDCETFHVLDLVFDPQKTLAGKARISKAPMTYLNRLGLKKKLKTLPAQTIRERTYLHGNKDRGGKKLLILALIIAAITGLRATGLTQYLDQEKLGALINGFGNWGPIIYMLIYTIAPSLLLPALPLSIAGGILFGPFWGVVYTITGATAGAGLAFFISRYVSAGFIKKRIKEDKWLKLNQSVSKNGWKVVAFTRLIPLFPFNLLNYAFGMTSIKFSHYILTTFICMLPACIALIVFSSSFLELLKGNLTREFGIGLVLMVIMATIPVIHKKIKKGPTNLI